MVDSNAGFFQRLSPKTLSIVALTVSVASVGWQLVQPLSHHVTLAAPPILDTGVQHTVNAGGASPLLGNHPQVVADVAEQVAPGVVNIDVSHTEAIRGGGSMYPGMTPMDDELFRQFFGLPGNPFKANGGAPAERIVQGNGSGVIISAEGHIITNNHVVNGATNVTVTLSDGRKLPAKVIGTDKYTDLAVLKINAPNLQPVPLGNSETLRPGEFVIAVGSPLGFDHTVTLGIVSAISRRVPDINMNLDFIQTDAAINPGNSGGPLVNLDGQVIGINTAISGRGQNIGFAIPVNVVRNVSQTLISSGTIHRPWVGIAMTPLNAELAKSLGLSAATEGIVVAQVMPDSPAEKAGFLGGDIIQRMDGQKVASAKEVQGVIQQLPLGNKVTFQVLRDGKLLMFTVTTQELPNNYSPNGK
ncbi:MAG: trypsin-like peptidase domain-containing protein [Vampirovibrionales bacterium]|nr:trypsin-like peptidase domain-containing protein [Vampirovibrionales bacterium]